MHDVVAAMSLLAQQNMAADVTSVVQSMRSLHEALSLPSLTETRGVRGNGGVQHLPRHMLSAVLLADNLKDLGQMASSVQQAIDLALSDGLAEHLQQQKLRVPSETSLLRFRIILDLASCLFSRDTFFHPQSRWACHVRADSSLQFGKDYFVTEIDHVDLDKVTGSTDLAGTRSLVTRQVLLLQLLGERSASAEQKCFRLLLGLSADVPDTDQTLFRTYSVNFDMGVESKLFEAPAAGLRNESLPLVTVPTTRQSPLDLVLPTAAPADVEACSMETLSDVSQSATSGRCRPRASPHHAGNEKLFLRVGLLPVNAERSRQVFQQL
ncbi:unnamed protein product, partial [Effrenium voratum]